MLLVEVDLVIRLFFLFPQSPIRLEINPKLGRKKKKKRAKDERSKQKKIHFSKTLIMENFPRNTHTHTKKTDALHSPPFSSKNYISET